MRNRSAQRPTTGHIATTLSVRQVMRTLGRCGMSVCGYDIEHVAAMLGAGGRLAYGASPHDGRGRPLVGARGRPLIQVSSLALCDISTAVVTIFHEIAHHRSYRAIGNGGTEAEAERYGQRMYEQFAHRWP
jgi:hypothetical protein